MSVDRPRSWLLLATRCAMCHIACARNCAPTAATTGAEQPERHQPGSPLHARSMHAIEGGAAVAAEEDPRQEEGRKSTRGGLAAKPESKKAKGWLFQALKCNRHVVFQTENPKWGRRCLPNPKPEKGHVGYGFACNAHSRAPPFFPFVAPLGVSPSAHTSVCGSVWGSPSVYTSVYGLFRLLS